MVAIQMEAFLAMIGKTNSHYKTLEKFGQASVCFSIKVYVFANQVYDCCQINFNEISLKQRL